MPMIMEDEMNVDDLFNDDSLLMIPARPHSTELHQRLDDLRSSGCRQSVAWSKWGCIASISSSGAALELRNLRCHPENGSWDLSEASLTPNFTTTLEGGPLKHLSWSPTGSDLAVLDAAGRVTILSIFNSLNKLSLSRHGSSSNDPADDLHGVVGSFWLNLNPFPAGRHIILNGPGIKEGSDSDYRYEASQAPVLGPYHPNHSKTAFICLTTNGLLRLIWCQTNGKWYESTTEIESIVSSNDLITHAAICPDKNNTLLICYATTNKELRSFRAMIDWNQPKNDKIPSNQLPVSPVIKTKHLAATSWAQDVNSRTDNGTNLESSMGQLSHLEFLQPCSDTRGNNFLPTIIAVRSHLPSASHYNQDVYTTIDRWEVREKAQSVHPAFEHLSSRRNSAGSQPGVIAVLKRLPSVTINKLVVTIDVMNLNRILVLAHSDGSVEYRDRATMQETFNNLDLNEVWHLSQIGFTYPQDEPCLEVAFSPTYCSLVAIQNDGKVKWKHLDYMGEIGNSMDSPIYAAFITALCLATATAAMKAVSYDDLLATAKKHATPQFTYDWLTELSRPLKIQTDYSEDTHHDVLVRNTIIQLCLGVQNSLGFKGEFNPRTFSGKFAWLVLQLRNIVVLIAMAANLNLSPAGTEKVLPLEDPEVIHSLAGSIRWILDLMAWLTDTLLELPKKVPSTIDLASPNMSLPDLLAHLHTTNTVSMHFILCSATRGFLGAICRRLLHLDFIARKAIRMPESIAANSSATANPSNPSQSPRVPSTLSPALRAAYTQIATLTNATIVQIKTMETLISSITTLVKEAYATQPATSGPSKARNSLETKMLFGGSFPEPFKSVIVQLYRPNGLLDTVKSEIEPSKLFFADFTMLETEDDRAAIERRRKLGKTMDCFRKGWLINPTPVAGPRQQALASTGTLAAGANGLGRQGARWRRCARCTSVMEDVLTQRQALQWLVMQQRRCFCSGFWNTMEPGEMIA